MCKENSKIRGDRQSALELALLLADDETNFKLSTVASSAVRAVVQAVFGNIEFAGRYGRYTYNDSRVNGFRVKLFVDSAIGHLNGPDLWKTRKLLESLAAGLYTVTVQPRTALGYIAFQYRSI